MLALNSSSDPEIPKPGPLFSETAEPLPWEVAQLLLEASADPDLQSMNGFSAFLMLWVVVKSCEDLLNG